MTGPAHAHRKPMGDLPAPHGASQPGPDLDVRADGPSQVAPETPAATMRRAVQRLRAIGMVTDALEGTGRIYPQDKFIGAVYAATAAVLDQAAERWDKETFGDDGGSAGPPWYHGVEATCGEIITIVGDTCRCFNPMIHLARAVLGEVRP